MNRPKDLDDHARSFWDRHAKRLKAEGLLTESTADSFVLLCKTYSHLQQLDPNAEKNGWLRWFALLKNYQTYARGFGMNTDKPRTPKPTDDKDEYGL